VPMRSHRCDGRWMPHENHGACSGMLATKTDVRALQSRIRKAMPRRVRLSRRQRKFSISIRSLCLRPLPNISRAMARLIEALLLCRQGKTLVSSG
jgi:hypothetical protein